MVTPGSRLVPTIRTMQNTKNLKVAEQARQLALLVYRLSRTFPT